MHTQLHHSDATGFMPGHLYRMTILTARDRDVITLVLAGHTNAEIAARLNMQLQTLKNALSAIYDKLGVSTRLQLAVLLLRDGVSITGQPAAARRVS
jgi:DNA-binding NarL/FixJ family response regulator